MRGDASALERAFELARSGAFATVSDVKRALRAEGYGDEQVTGPQLRRQLREIILNSQCVLPEHRA